MFQTRFRLELSFGLCVGVELPLPVEGAAMDPLDGLHPAEVAVAADFPVRRKLSFAGGRHALARALQELGAPREAVLSDDRGAPVMPQGFVGSVSHKDTLAVALVARGQAAHIGVDLEPWLPERPKIARLVLTEAERVALGESPAWRDLLLRFSLKEAIYKAIDPSLRRYVTFKEVEVTPRDDGSATVNLMLTQGEQLEVEARWKSHHDYLITSARARR